MCAGKPVIINTQSLTTVQQTTESHLSRRYRKIALQVEMFDFVSTGINPCGANNERCTHLCLLSPRAPYFTCLCPHDAVNCSDQPREVMTTTTTNSPTTTTTATTTTNSPTTTTTTTSTTTTTDSPTSTTTASTTDDPVTSEKYILYCKENLVSHVLSQYLDNGISINALITPNQTTLSTLIII